MSVVRVRIKLALQGGASDPPQRARWLAQHFDDIGNNSTVDLHAMFLRAKPE